MLPKMVQGASLQFVSIQSLNNEAIEFSKSIGKSEMIELFIETRRRLVNSFNEKWDGDVLFMLDGHPSNMVGYLNIFNHHDQEHKAQIIDFLHNLTR